MELDEVGILNWIDWVWCDIFILAKFSHAYAKLFHEAFYIIDHR